MHMIRLNIHFKDFDLFLLRKGSDTATNLISDGSLQYPVTVFGYPNNMVLAVPDGM